MFGAIAVVMCLTVAQWQPEGKASCQTSFCSRAWLHMFEAPRSFDQRFCELHLRDM